MGLSVPMADRPYLNLAVRPNELPNVWYKVQVKDLLGVISCIQNKVADR